MHDHAGGATLEDLVVVAEPEGTGGRPGSQTETELTARDSADLMKLPSDSDHHPRYGDKHPGTERSVEIGFDADDADLSQGHGEHDEEGRTERI